MIHHSSMTSFALPCPKVSLLLSSKSSDSAHHRNHIANYPRSDSTFSASSILTQFQGSSRRQSDVFKVAAEKSTISASASGSGQAKESQSQHEVPDALSISDFMNQVSDLIKLVDSRDIVELQLRQMGCEVHIKKKEAMPQPSYAAAPAYLPPPPQPASPPPQTPPAPTSVRSASTASTPAPTPLAPTKKKSSHPPFKCPMAGNFYRSPAPGAPPFVKVGDKIQKGQVLCIIEAMKLMNEIESDQAGTVVEILVDDGKPVSIDTPMFVIEP